MKCETQSRRRMNDASSFLFLSFFLFSFCFFLLLCDRPYGSISFFLFHTKPDMTVPVPSSLSVLLIVLEPFPHPRLFTYTFSHPASSFAADASNPPNHPLHRSLPSLFQTPIPIRLLPVPHPSVLLFDPFHPSFASQPAVDRHQRSGPRRHEGL